MLSPGNGGSHAISGAWREEMVRRRGGGVYRRHNAPLSRGLRVYTSGQKRGVTEPIKRELPRRSAVEPVVGHLKTDHRMGRNHLAGCAGDAINALMAAVGCNFRLPGAWLAVLLCPIQTIIPAAARRNSIPFTPDQHTSQTTT